MDFFLDASPLVRLVLEAEGVDEAEDLLSGVEAGAHKAYCTPLVLEEVTYKLTLAKASELLGANRFFDIKRGLKDERSVRVACGKMLSELRDYIEILQSGGLSVAEVIYDDWKRSLRYVQEKGLLPADALHLSVMARLGVKTIASFDDDFRQLRGIKVIP